VQPGDTEQSLHARIQVEEHELYPLVVAAFLNGNLEVNGRMVDWR
jgi:folate-dependent phosphoribosylglycinamide formyltransferase PurN